MGIAGSGQSTIAEIAKAYGHEVSGCDLKIGGHDVAHLQGVDILAVTPAVYFQNVNDPELVEGQKKNILMTGQEFMGKYLHKDKFVICIAGTHGKSTTTAMTGNVLTDAGLDPTVFIGASGSRSGKGKYFVTEADEYYENFLNYHPDIVILNNIELDHPEYFHNFENLVDTYRKFLCNIKPGGVLIYNEVVEQTSILKSQFPNKFQKIKYSINEYPKNLVLKVPGDHNKANAMGVIKLAELLKLPKIAYEKALGDFSGIDRRLQELGTVNGITVIDDYANHPTAFAANIKAVQEKYPNRSIWAIIEPHTFSRLRAVLPELAPALANADHVIISKIFASREQDPGDFTGEDISKSIPGSLYIPELSKIIRHLTLNIKHSDVVLVMGSGNSDKLAREILVSTNPPYLSGTKGLIIYKNKILLILRDNKPDIPFPNTWEWIGGGQEENETLKETGLREMKEELNIQPNIYIFLGSINRKIGRFLAILDDDEFKKVSLGNEGQKYGLFTLEETLAMTITPGLRKFIELNIQEIKNIFNNKPIYPQNFTLDERVL